MAETHTIIYTQTDEAPALATASLLPIIGAFTAAAGVEVELRDISLAYTYQPLDISSEEVLFLSFAGRTFVMSRHALWDLRFPIHGPCALCHNHHWPWECRALSLQEGPADLRPVCPLLRSFSVLDFPPPFGDSCLPPPHVCCVVPYHVIHTAPVLGRTS